MFKKGSEKKIKLRTVFFALLVFVFFYLIFIAILIYGLGVDNKLTQKTAAYVPYPVASWGANFITESKLKSQLGSVRRFYENQDFSGLGARVDFGTEDGKKRLKIKEKNILNKLIEDKLIENEAKKRGIVIKSEDVSQEVSRKMREYDSEEYLKDNMKRLYGWSIADFEENIVKPDLYRAKLFSDIREKDEAGVEAKNKISGALEELKKGGKFESVAGKYSEGESAKNGGDLGWFGASEMLPELAVSVFGLKNGEQSEILESSLGYHIIKVEGRKIEDDVEKLKLKQIFVRAVNFSDWLEQYEKNFDINIFSKDFFWNKNDGQVEFKNNDLKNFEENLEKNSPGDISVLF